MVGVCVSSYKYTSRDNVDIYYGLTLILLLDSSLFQLDKADAFDFDFEFDFDLGFDLGFD